MISGFQYDVVVGSILVAVALIALIVIFARKTIIRARRNAEIRSKRRRHLAVAAAAKHRADRMWTMLEKQ
jgi:hypothetical protein